MKAIEVRANKKNRTYTIRCTEKNGYKSKFRTIPMSKEEFENAEYWTANDWQQFLKTDDYYTV